MKGPRAVKARTGLFQCRIDRRLAKAAEQAAARAGIKTSPFYYQLLERCGVIRALEELAPWGEPAGPDSVSPAASGAPPRGRK